MLTVSSEKYDHAFVPLPVGDSILITKIFHSPLMESKDVVIRIFYAQKLKFNFR